MRGGAHVRAAISEHRERPIILSDEEVRGVLAGRKAQIRRLAKVTNVCATGGTLDYSYISTGRRACVVIESAIEAPSSAEEIASACPHGAPGDGLWVRETWGDADVFYQDHTNEVPSCVAYRADKSAILFNAKKPTTVPSWDLASWNWDHLRWRSPSHMPRWASRLALGIEAVGVEPDPWTWVITFRRAS